jgi:hypothetical protein
MVLGHLVVHEVATSWELPRLRQCMQSLPQRTVLHSEFSRRVISRASRLVSAAV